MNAKEILESAESRIREHRTAEAEISFVDNAGRPLGTLVAEVKLARHEFKLGANAYRLAAIEDKALQQAYEERFATLLNYATLPFYWGGYEREKDATSEKRLMEMADWCARHGITTKGHPLVWHEVFPAWAEKLEDSEALSRQEKRVRSIVSGFKGRIDIWDVVNEATVSHRFGNAVGRWIAKEGAESCVLRALQWAHEANPQAALLYNDFNVSEAFEKLVAGLIQRRAPMHTIGIQSHMHGGHWPLEKVWQTCETYSRFGLPLHFTELTILSGRFKSPEDKDWHKVHTDWDTTAEGEARQLEFGQQFYTTLFSHPAMEAITWWDFSDHGSWQGAPAGMVRKDMTAKPLYEWLVDAFQRRWSTRGKLTTDAGGRATMRGFLGDYEVTGKLPSGNDVRGRFSLLRKGERPVRVVME